MLILKGKKSGVIVGKYKGMLEARKMFTDANTYLAAGKDDTELLLMDGEHIIMKIQREQTGMQSRRSTA